MCWSVVVLELLAWAAMRMGDAMVIPTLLAYGARWVWLLPVVALAPLSLWRRSVVLPLAVAFSVGLVGIMQFQWPHLAPTNLLPADDRHLEWKPGRAAGYIQPAGERLRGRHRRDAGMGAGDRRANTRRMEGPLRRRAVRRLAPSHPENRRHVLRQR